MDLPPVPYKYQRKPKLQKKTITNIATGEIASLDHELLDNAVEGGALVAEALLAGSEGAEVLSSLGDGLAVEAYYDAADVFVAMGDVEVNLVLLACGPQRICSCV